MLPYLTIFLASVVHVFLKASQQINVVKGYYWRIPLISFCMAACEVLAITLIVSTNLWAILPLGLGGAIGCWGAMRVNKIRRDNGTS